MTGEELVLVRRLVVRYGENLAVKSIDVTVRRGEVVGLIGPDGAGKTSTLRVIAGLHRAAAGSIEVLGRPAWKQRRSLHQHLGYLAQRFALYGDLTVDENIQFFALLYGIPSWRERRDMLLGRVGLAPFRDRQADRLSGGMRQKLALACSLMHAPSILLLDEPTTGVDPITRREFWRLLAELVAEGLTLVIATPYLDEAERCSRVVLIHEGRVLADARPAELRATLPGVVVEVEALPRDRAMGVLAGFPGAIEVQPFAARFHVRFAGPVDVAAIRTALERAGAAVSEAREVTPTLEDAFLHLTRAHHPASPGEAA